MQRGMTSVFTRNIGVEGVKRHMQNTHHIRPALQNATTSTTKAFKVLNCICFLLGREFWIGNDAAHCNYPGSIVLSSQMEEQRRRRLRRGEAKDWDLPYSSFGEM